MEAICAPPPTMPVTDSTSGGRVHHRQTWLGNRARGTTSNGRPLATPCASPQRFPRSSWVAPRMLPGDGCVRMSRPSASGFGLDAIDHAQGRRPTSGCDARGQQVLRARSPRSRRARRRRRGSTGDRRRGPARDSTRALTCNPIRAWRQHERRDVAPLPRHVSPRAQPCAASAAGRVRWLRSVPPSSWMAMTSTGLPRRARRRPASRRSPARIRARPPAPRRRWDAGSTRPACRVVCMSARAAGGQMQQRDDVGRPHFADRSHTTDAQIDGRDD